MSTPAPFDLEETDVEAVDELFAAWQQRCVATGCATGPDDQVERFALLVALERSAAPGALARVRGTLSGRLRTTPGRRPAGEVAARRQSFDEAASTWGARLGAPALVVQQAVILRRLLTGTIEGERLGRLVDRLMLVATRAATDELQRAAFSDPLTGCANRRALERDLERELARCARAELDLCVVALDVDGLKHINDTAGHAAGDETLLRLVETLRRALRGLDTVYRVGGDEFIVVLPDTSPDDASRVMARVEDLGAPSFSWGASSVSGIGSLDGRLLLKRADEELYHRRRAARGLGRPAPARPGPGSRAGALDERRQAGATG